jgi:hypothetical protein
VPSAWSELYGRCHGPGGRASCPQGRRLEFAVQDSAPDVKCREIFILTPPIFDPRNKQAAEPWAAIAAQWIWQSGVCGGLSGFFVGEIPAQGAAAVLKFGPS